MAKKAEKSPSLVSGEEEDFIEKFGFHVPTSCGYIAMDNTWSEDWPVCNF